jgi:D-beta-D-heptose 7-phosphate kinase/D-beta-D-heptose 1-phosphate adenosyltransferase
VTPDGFGKTGRFSLGGVWSEKDRATVLSGFEGRRCLVVGDTMLDVFEHGRAVKLAPDAPVPVVCDVERTSSPGGAANAAANLRALGAEVSLVSAVGDDGAAAELLGALSAAGVRTQGSLRVPGRETVTKRRVQADRVTLARLDSGHTGPLPQEYAREVARRVAEGAREAEVVVVSDYSGGVVDREVAAALRGHGLVVLDSKEPLRLRWEGLAAATPNHLEAQEALGLAPEGDPSRIDGVAVCLALGDRLGARLLALTLAEDGVLLADGSGATTRVPGRPVREAHPNGAGDTFLSAFALALGCGAAPEVAARMGVEAATLAVARPGTAPVGLAELRERLGASGSGAKDATLEDDLRRVRGSGGRVVFSSAGFDPATPEGLRALRGARALGDLLVVGLGKEDGGTVAALLRELRCVDHVVAFEDANEVLRRVSPDVWVLAGEPGDAGLVRKARSCGGEVVPASALLRGAEGYENGRSHPVILPGARG